MHKFQSEDIRFSELLLFKDGTVFHKMISYPDSLGMDIRRMFEGYDEGFSETNNNYFKTHTYGKSYSSAWGRYSINEDTLIIEILENYNVAANRILGWRKNRYLNLIKSDSLLSFQNENADLISSSITYAIHNPNIKLDFIDTRKAWIYKYNPYPEDQ